jgi:hypothetical protein
MGLQLVELVMEIEDDFGILVPDDLASKCISVGDTHQMIVELLVAKGSIRSIDLEERVWDQLVAITSEQFGMTRDRIHPQLRWIPDIAPNG